MKKQNILNGKTNNTPVWASFVEIPGDMTPLCPFVIDKST